MEEAYWSSVERQHCQAPGAHRWPCPQFLRDAPGLERRIVGTMLSGRIRKIPRFSGIFRWTTIPDCLLEVVRVRPIRLDELSVRVDRRIHQVLRVVRRRRCKRHGGAR